MLFGKLIDSLLPSLKNTANDAGGRSIAGRYINFAVKELYLTHPWVYRKKSKNLILMPNYETGTCSVTEFTGANETAARTVTFSGSTLTVQMQGRFLQVQGSDNWHKIINDPSSGTVYLDTPITRTSASGLTFKIWKRFYYLPSEVVSVLAFKKPGGKINFKSSSILANEVSSLDTEGSPVFYSDYGIDPYEDTIYSTGTISIAANSNVVIGVDTAALGNIDAGDIMTVNEIDYRVKRAESPLRWILSNYIGETAIAAGASYEIKKDNPLGFQFYYSSDEYKVVSYDCLVRTYDMINESEERPPLPEDFDKAILSRAESLFLKDKDDPKWTQVLQLYAAEVDGKKISNDPVTPTYFEFSPSIPSGLRNRR